MINITPIKVLKDGISLNKKYPGIIDIMINEYSNNDTTDGEAIIQAVNIQTNAKNSPKTNNPVF